MISTPRHHIHSRALSLSLFLSCRYVAKELKRLGGLLGSGSVLEHKKAGLRVRFNVLRQFQQLRQHPSSSSTGGDSGKEL
jgi:hypothetical protein